jgi:UDP-N-acetylglucosamine 3-dehydrogenase
MVVVAVVGTGYWGRNHVRTFCTLREEGLVKRVIVCDSNQQRAMEIGDEFNCEFAVDATALSEMGVTMVTIATPTPSHATLAKKLMKMGLDVLVEKPLAMNTKEANEVIQVANDTGQLLLVGHVFRHHSGVRMAAKLVKDGEIGRVRHIISERLATREPRPDNGVIAALGIHDFDICCDILGGIEPVKIEGVATESSISGIEDHASLQMTFQNGVVAFVELSWRSRVRGKVRSLQIIGTDGSISLDYLEHKGLWLHHHPNDAHGEEYGGFGSAPKKWIEINDGEQALTAELRDFVLRSTGQRSGPTLNGGDVGLQGMKRVELALFATGFENQLQQ